MIPYSSGTNGALSSDTSLMRQRLTVYLPRLYLVADLLRTSPINLTPHAKRGTKNFKHSSFQFFGQTFETHSSRNPNDLV